MATPSTPAPRVQRILATMVLAIVAMSVLAFLAVIVGTAVGMQSADFAAGIWPAVAVLPLVGLPIACVLLIVVVVLAALRRARDARG
jgi:hypothetical protein